MSPITNINSVANPPSYAAMVAAFVDGIPASVPAQIAQLVSMHAVAHMATSTDHTRNGVVSSLATTVISLLVAVLGNVLRGLMVWMVSLIERDCALDDAGADTDDRPTKADLVRFRELVSSTTTDAVGKLPYSYPLNSVGGDMYLEKWGGGVGGSMVAQVQFSFNVCGLAQSTKFLVHATETANVYIEPNELPNTGTALLREKAAKHSTLAMTVPQINGNTRQTIGIVCLSLNMVRSATNGDDVKARQLLNAYRQSPVYQSMQRLYSNSIDSIHLVVAVVQANYYHRQKARKEYMERTSDDVRPFFIQDLVASQTGSSIDPPTYTVVGNTILSPQYTLDSLVLECKSVLVNALDKFTRKEMYPAGLAMTNKLSILNYGPPGTGKTKCARVVANHLRRDLLRIDCSKFLNFNEQQFLETVQERYRTHVIELDEFDHVLATMDAQIKAQQIRERRAIELRNKFMLQSAEWGFDDSDEEEAPAAATASDATTSTTPPFAALTSAAPTSATTTSAALTSAATTSVATTSAAPTVPAVSKRDAALIKEMNMLLPYGKSSRPRPMTIQFLLRWLDGLGNDAERVIILNTNNPQLIRPDFYRPGRIDVKLYCGYCTPGMMAKITETKFPRNEEWDQLEVEAQFIRLEHRNITPMHFINSMSESDDLGTFMELLEEMPLIPDYPHKQIFESDAQRRAKNRAAAKREARLANHTAPSVN